MPQKALMATAFAHSPKIGPAIEAAPASSPTKLATFWAIPTKTCISLSSSMAKTTKVFGAWKVYTNVEQALTTFDSYRACTQYLTYIYQQGCTLGQLTQATR